jgi:hypothetical protein
MPFKFLSSQGDIATQCNVATEVGEIGTGDISWDER